MFKLKYFLAVSLVILFASCHGHGKMHIVINNGSDYHVDIQRVKHVVFTKDSTAIKSIEPGGYLSFEKNEKRLRAEYDKSDGIYMEIYENGKLIPNEQGKAFLAEAVKEVVERNVGVVSN